MCGPRSPTNAICSNTLRCDWLDSLALLGSLPQGSYQTPAERSLFSATLPGINVLYLGMHVLILLDRQYIGRFWTCFETFLATKLTLPMKLSKEYCNSHQSRRP